MSEERKSVKDLIEIFNNAFCSAEQKAESLDDCWICSFPISQAGGEEEKEEKEEKEEEKEEEIYYCVLPAYKIGED